MRARARGVTAFAVATACALTFGADAGTAGAPPALKGVTTITAKRTSVVTVTLPRAARIDLEEGFHSDAIRASGRGRIFGIAFTSVHGDEPVLLSAMVFSRCSAPGCVPKAPFRPEQMVFVQGARRLTPPNEPGATFELPAGRYHAHVFTDGTPVSFEIRLRGLSGSGRITASAAHRATFAQPKPSLPVTGPVYSAGASAPARGPLTLMAHVVTQRSQPHVEHVESTCYYHDSNPPGGHVLPGCPGGSSGFLFDIGYVTLDYQSVSYGYAVAQAEGDSWFQGAYADGVQGPGEFTTTLFWSDLRI